MGMTVKDAIAQLQKYNENTPLAVRLGQDIYYGVTTDEVTHILLSNGVYLKDGKKATGDYVAIFPSTQDDQ